MSGPAIAAVMKHMRAHGVGDLEIVYGCITAMSDRLAAAGGDRKALMDTTTLIVGLRSAREFVRDREAYTLADEVLHILTNGAPDDVIEWMRETRGPPGVAR